MQSCLTCRSCQLINQPGVRFCLRCRKALYVVVSPRLTREQIKGLIIALSVLAFVFMVRQSVRPQKPASKPAPCAITVEKSPEVRGFKLGQPYQSHDRDRDYDLVGGAKADEYNLRRLYLVNYKGQSQRLKGINRIELQYLDEKLAYIQINYSDDVKWQSDVHFAAAIAEQLGLPDTSWVNIYHPTLKCDGFTVETSVSTGGILTIQTSTLDAELRKRKATLEQKKRVDFKP